MTPDLRAALRTLDQQFDAVRAMPKPVSEDERRRLGIEDVGVGGYIRVAGQPWRVVSLGRYKEKKSSWLELELFGLESGETVYLEWEKDDAIEVALNGRAITLRELGVSADDVEEMSDEEDGIIRHQGKTYRYEDDYGATYHRDDGPDGEAVYFYDFETEDGRFCLTIEEWGGDDEGYDYDAYVSEYIEPASIDVLVAHAPESTPGR